MNKQEFVQCTLFIKKQAMELPQGKKRNMYVILIGCSSNVDRINNRNIKFVEFDTSINWASNHLAGSWFAIVFTKHVIHPFKYPLL